GVEKEGGRACSISDRRSPCPLRADPDGFFFDVGIEFERAATRRRETERQLIGDLVDVHADGGADRLSLSPRAIAGEENRRHAALFQQRRGQAALCAAAEES